MTIGTDLIDKIVFKARKHDYANNTACIYVEISTDYSVCGSSRIHISGGSKLADFALFSSNTKTLLSKNADDNREKLKACQKVVKEKLGRLSTDLPDAKKGPLENNLPGGVIFQVFSNECFGITDKMKTELLATIIIVVSGTEDDHAVAMSTHEVLLGYFNGMDDDGFDHKYQKYTVKGPKITKTAPN